MLVEDPLLVVFGEAYNMGVDCRTQCLNMTRLVLHKGRILAPCVSIPIHFVV
jgi:hypothetical protein